MKRAHVLDILYVCVFLEQWKRWICGRDVVYAVIKC